MVYSKPFIGLHKIFYCGAKMCYNIFFNFVPPQTRIDREACKVDEMISFYNWAHIGKRVFNMLPWCAESV